LRYLKDFGTLDQLPGHCCEAPYRQISAQKSGSTKGDERETNYRQELTP
jgi:hypothetical protein